MSLFGFIALLFALIAWRRTRTARALVARVEKLEREVAALRRIVRATAVPPLPPPEVSEAAAEHLAPPAPDDGADEPFAARPEGDNEVHDAPPPAADPLERPPLTSAPPPAAPWQSLDWERLFGVRAAAVLGGIALALAGLLFFKYSIEHGLIPPWLRVVLGTTVGIACIGGGEWTLRRRYAATADALAGGGLVVLYAAFWAASVRYELVPLGIGFALMIAVTATGCALAARHQALVTALIGLIGGFATPLLLSSGSDRPIGLFAYVLLLDVALLVLARRDRWPWLALFSLAGTLLYQVLWIGVRMGPDRLHLGLVILGVFAVVFAVAGRFAPAEDRRGWWLTAAAAVLAPFAFALYFAVDADFGPDLDAVAALLVLLTFAAGWLAQAQDQPGLALGAAAASLGVFAVWVAMRLGGDGVSAWQLTLWCGALAAALHVFVERDPMRADARGPTPAAALAAAGGFVLTIAASPTASSLAPWLVGWSILAALLLRQAGLPGRAPLHLVAALGVGFALTVLRNAHDGEAWFPSLALYLPLPIAAALAFQAVALRRREGEAARFAEHAAALLPLVLLLYLEGDPQAPAVPFLLGTLVLGLLASFAGSRLGAGGWLLAAMAVTALAHDTWSRALLLGDDPAALAGRALALQALAVVAFTGWPFLVARRYRLDRPAWPAAALAGPAWFLSLRRLYELRFGDAAIGLLPVALGALAVLALRQARAVGPRDEPLRTEVLAWFGAVALGFVTLAVPLQLAREWITIAWALEGVAVAWLWRRLDHPGLKYFGLALLGAVAVRLIANPAVLGYYPRPAWRIVNWLLYTYLVPAAALFGASRILAALELPRQRDWERPLYAGTRPWGAIATGLAGLAVVFVWINLAIADWFSSGGSLVVSFERLPARDLATSIAWAVYALALLVLGVVRRSIGMRWASLALLLATIAKVFLHDLGELRDLYRVASLLGLAISLILVSLAYQRFVFGSDAAEETR
ncbi:MAG TPA: DUF2339 domain-containing protein [Candidatus Dormibacteraeota bacterium]|nr:DUF2339 domain-containing protein [Candidatus Dormibacteraeota bacterium]